MFFVILDDVDTLVGHYTPGDVVNLEQFTALVAVCDNLKSLAFNNEADAMAVGGGY